MPHTVEKRADRAAVAVEDVPDAPAHPKLIEQSEPLLPAPRHGAAADAHTARAVAVARRTALARRARWTSTHAAAFASAAARSSLADTAHALDAGRAGRTDRVPGAHVRGIGGAARRVRVLVARVGRTAVAWLARLARHARGARTRCRRRRGRWRDTAVAVAAAGRAGLADEALGTPTHAGVAALGAAAAAAATRTAAGRAGLTRSAWRTRTRAGATTAWLAVAGARRAIADRGTECGTRAETRIAAAAGRVTRAAAAIGTGGARGERRSQRRPRAPRSLAASAICVRRAGVGLDANTRRARDVCGTRGDHAPGAGRRRAAARRVRVHVTGVGGAVRADRRLRRAAAPATVTVAAPECQRAHKVHRHADAAAHGRLSPHTTPIALAGQSCNAAHRPQGKMNV